MAEITGQNFVSTRVASGDLSASQWLFVSFIAGDRNVFLASSGQVTFGVLANKPRSKEHAAVITQGHAKIHVASSLGAGTEVGAGASGFAVAANSGASWVSGILLASATSGGVAEMRLTGYGTAAI
jgi:hypothetical protein